MQKNVFTPAFGKRPKVFIERDDIKLQFLAGLDNPDSPWRNTVLLGARGTGKTAFLADIKSSLSDEIIVISIASRGEILDEILLQLYNQASQLTKIKQNLKSFNANILGISIGGGIEQPDFLNTFRGRLTRLLDEVAKSGSLVLFLVDEIQEESPEVRQFVTTYQQLLMENYNVALLMAGLPQSLEKIFSDKILTFFRRANRIYLKNINVSLVELDYQAIFARNFKLEDSALITKAAEATCGYAYLVQLIGYYLWENLVKEMNGEPALADAILRSKILLFQNVHDVVFDELSANDRAYCFAMLEDKGPTRFSDVQERLGKKKNQLSQYRARLLAKGVIKAVGHGEVEFTLPYMKEYLKNKY